MRLSLTLGFLGAIAAIPAPAQEFTAQCTEVYNAIVADIPMDYQSCAVEVADYALETCEPPRQFNAALPTSHLLLAIDASGSMAGRIGGETKMAIAQREALAFLSDLPDEVAVGLIVYGHRGNNQDDGKAESCAASELIHDFDADRAALDGTIAGLSPTGWTPMGGALDFAATIVAALPDPGDGPALAPVVYMISDGEETCDGDPVAAAQALYDAGVRTTVNTIGFAVDAETTAQLEAIAAAGGGTYYPAEDASALRSQLDAIKETEASLARYRYCVDLNAGLIASVYHNARTQLAGCFQRNNPINARTSILNAMNKAERDGLPEAVCADALRQYALFEMDSGGDWLARQSEPLTQQSVDLVNAYRDEAYQLLLTPAD